MPTPDEYAEFNSLIEFQKRQSMNPTQEYADNSPYGTQMQSGKPGLTKRGKAALGIGVAVIAGGSLIGYQSYADSAAQHEAKAQELAIKSQQLELAKLQEMNRANEAGQKVEKTVNTARQSKVDACVKNNKDLVGKTVGSSYRDIVDACQAQYTDTTSSGDDMQAAAASSQDTNSGAGGGINNLALLVGGGLAVGFVAVAKKSKRSNPA